MNLRTAVRGPYVVARHEFMVNLRSVRLLIMLLVLALLVVGGAYGLSGGLGGGGPGLFPLRGWGHAANSTTGEHLAVVWVSDPFGAPLSGRSVRFYERDIQGNEVTLAEPSTDTDGFARFPAGNRTEVLFTVTSGNAQFGSAVFWFSPPLVNFTTAFWNDDLDGDGIANDAGVHVLTLAGEPADARISLNGTLVTSTDVRGYARVQLPLGSSNLTVEVGGETETTVEVVNPEPTRPPFFSGPDFVLLIIAGGFATFVLPIFAIVITFDAISKERVQGTLDLLLSRPVSRIGTVLGKFTGTFAAVAVPVTCVNLAGIGIITAVSEQAPTGSFAAAFLGLSLLLVAFFVLLQLTLSTLAKTSGTAILFGVLSWLAFSVLYPVITLVLSSVFFANNFEAQFRFLQLAVLGNPSQIYQQLVAFAAPRDIGSGFGQFGGTALELPVVASAATVWVVLLAALALWTFHRKAAE